MSSIQINVLPVSTGIVNTTETELLVATSLNETNCIKNINLPCEGFNKSSIQCFGSSLPYDSTSFELVSDASNFEEAKEKLLLWSGKLKTFHISFCKNAKCVCFYMFLLFNCQINYRHCYFSVTTSIYAI